MTRTGIGSFGAFLIALASPTLAHASEVFPHNIESYWRVGSLPVAGQGCKLCHTSDPGRSGTATQPFAKTMIDRGLKDRNVRSLQGALDDVRIHATSKPIVDSDRDGVADYTEIHDDHTNPNDPRDFKVPPPPPPDAGGEGGGTGEPSGGGAAGVDPGIDAGVEEPPPYFPPEASDLPPPYVHGCALSSHGEHGARTGALAWFGLAGVVLTRTLRSCRGPRRPRSHARRR